MTAKRVRKTSRIFPDSPFPTVGTVDDVAEALGVTPRRVQQLQAAGFLPRYPRGEYNIGVMKLLHMLRKAEGFHFQDPETGAEAFFEMPKRLVYKDSVDEDGEPIPRGIVYNPNGPKAHLNRTGSVSRNG